MSEQEDNNNNNLNTIKQMLLCGAKVIGVRIAENNKIYLNVAIVLDLKNKPQPEYDEEENQFYGYF